jgi:hypothetical protein
VLLFKVTILHASSKRRQNLSLFVRMAAQCGFPFLERQKVSETAALALLLVKCELISTFEPIADPGAGATEDFVR